MAEPSVTRKDLRRAIARALRMEFFLRVGAGEIVTAAGSTTTVIKSAALVQADNYWKNGWIYVPSTGEERKIVSSSLSGTSITLEYALTGAPAAGVAFEIHDTYSPALIHDAVNRAIRESGRYFTDEIIDYLVLEEDKLVYDLTALARTPWALNQVWVENYQNTAIHGQPTLVDSTWDPIIVVQDTKSLGTTGSMYNGWMYTVYAGPGVGRWQLVQASNDPLQGGPHTIKVTYSVVYGDVTTASKFCIYNTAQKQEEDYRLTDLHLDRPEFPTTLYLHHLLPEWYGFRVRLHYTAYPSELTLDTSSTYVDQEFIINQAMAYLHEGILNNNQSDAGRHQGLAQMLRGVAQARLIAVAPRKPTGTAWRNVDGQSYPLVNPLGWGG
jgi:hypothetical protein